MLVSTKLATLVQLVSSGQLLRSQRLTPRQPPQCTLPRPGVAPLLVHEAGQLPAQERRDRDTLLGGEDPRLLQDLFVQKQGDVPSQLTPDLRVTRESRDNKVLGAGRRVKEAARTRMVPGGRNS